MDGYVYLGCKKSKERRSLDDEDGCTVLVQSAV